MIRRHKGPRRRRWHELREKRGRGIVLLPSLLTTGNLFCGFFALLLTVEGRFTDAALAIFVAMVMDLLDGRVARLMKATSQFGVEFDSLADVVSFCVAPAFLVYSFALKDLSRPAWFGAFLFVICGALRLARFNVQTGTVDRRFFIGLSTPAAAGVIASSRGAARQRAPGALGADRARGRGRGAGLADGLHVPLLELQGSRLRAAPAAAVPPGRRPGHHDRGHQARRLPLRALHRLCAVGTGAARARRAVARGAGRAGLQGIARRRRGWR